MKNEKSGSSGQSRLRCFLTKGLLPAVFWLLVWQVSASALAKPLMLPTPAVVFSKLWELMGTARFYEITGTSLFRILVGMILGSLGGILLALLTSYVKVMDWIFSPAVRILRTIPVASFILLILLWISRGEVPGVVSGIMVLPIVWESTAAGIRAVPEKKLEMAKAYEMGRWKTWRFVRLPAIIPHLLSGLSNAVGLAWKSGVAAEVLCVPVKAIGTQVYHSKIYLETETLFAWTLVVVVLSITIEGLIKRLVRKGMDAWK